MSEPLRRKGRREVDPDVLEAEKGVRLALAEELNTLRKERGWTIRHAADTADMNAITLCDILHAKRPPEFSSLVRLAMAFDLRLVIRFE